MQILPLTHDNLIAVSVSDTFTAEELDHFKTFVREVIEQFGEVRVYFEMEQFDGWEIGSFVENALFDLFHAHQYSKVAMVGEKNWQAWMTKIVDLVKSGPVRYFDLSQRAEAMEWIQQGSIRTMTSGTK
jgi:hypothetical protein